MQTSGMAAGLAACALWAMVFVAPRIAPGFTAVDLTAGRFVVYGALSLVLLAWGPPLRWLGWPAMAMAALLSVLGFTAYYLLLVMAIRYAGVELPSLVIGTIPVWMLLLGRPRGMRVSTLAPGMLLTIAGLGLVTADVWMHAQGVDTGPAGTDRPAWKMGAGYAVLAMASWTAFALINSAWLKKNPHITASSWANWMGIGAALGSMALWWMAGSNWNFLVSQPGLQKALLVCLVTGVGSAWLGTLLWNLASQRLAASLGGQLIVSETVFALAYAFLLGGMAPTASQWFAGLCFVFGIVLTVRTHARLGKVTGISP
jgi:drug/metabolite transporter (DMT)-like permease